MIQFTLSYDGLNADDHELDFYDVSKAMIGFQRSLAIVSHLVINGQIITQAPALKNARIMAKPPKEGSWTITAGVLFAAYKISTAPRNTPLGHLVCSAYDYVVSEALGFHVDYEQTIGQQYKKLKQQDQLQGLPEVTQTQLDSALEKSIIGIEDMHRPIIKSSTARTARILSNLNGEKTPLSHTMNVATYGHISDTRTSETTFNLIGKVSSFNTNTSKGRIYIPQEQRPIPFILNNDTVGSMGRIRIGDSLLKNIQNPKSSDALVKVTAYKQFGLTGKLKGLSIMLVEELLE